MGFFKRLRVSLWNWQTRHTNPKWISLNTGECVSTLGKLLSGRFCDYDGLHIEYVWVSLRDYNAGKYNGLLNGIVDRM